MSDVRLTALNPDDSSPVPVACDAAGKLLLQDVPTFDGNLDGNLNVTGSGAFAGNVTVGAFAGDGSSAGIIASAGSGFYVSNTGSSGSLGNADTAIRLYSPSGLNYVLATDGTQYIGGDLASSLANAKIFLSTNGAATFASDVTVTDGSLSVTRDDDVNWAGTFKCNGTRAFGVNINTPNSTSSGSVALKVKNQDVDTVTIKPEGSAEFAAGNAGFTSDGHLWCTTQAGDTVVLNSVSGGTATWASYTPPTRADLIKEKIEDSGPSTKPILD